MGGRIPVKVASATLALATVFVGVSGSASPVAAATRGGPSAPAANRSGTVDLWVNASGSGTSCAASNPCPTITGAEDYANANLAGDDVVIHVAAGTYNEGPIGVGGPTVHSMTVEGAGAATTTVQGNRSNSVFEVLSGIATISGLTITGGSSDQGGGVWSDGNLTLKADLITGNWAGAGSIDGGVGGGVYNRGTAVLTGDVISNNVAYYGGGGGIENAGTVSLASDTISGNSAQAGGGIEAVGPSTTITDSTFSSDGASYGGAVIGSAELVSDTFTDNHAARGGAVLNQGNTTLVDDTLAYNKQDISRGTVGGPGIASDGGSVVVSNSILDSSGCYGTITDGGYNVESDNSCGFGATSVVNSATIGLAASSQAQNGSPGPQTMAISPGSSAYGEVPASACTVTTDERGDPRPGAGRAACDAGAYEWEPPPISITPSTFRDATKNVVYQQNLTAAGGTAPYAFSASSGGLPPGLKLSAAGVLSGTPTTEGTYNFTVVATDADGYVGRASYTLAVEPQNFAVTPSTLPGMTDNSFYTQTLSASAGASPVAFALTGGSLPGGMQLTSEGVLSGSPSPAGSYTFTITATDADGFSASQTYTVLVEPTGASPVSISPTSLPDATPTVFYNQTLTASGGTGPYTYAVTAGSLPVGFSLVPTTGVVDGKSNVPESSWFEVTATDSTGRSAMAHYVLAVVAGTLNISPGALPSLTSGQNYDQVISWSGGVGPYTYSVTSGSIPGNMSLTQVGPTSVALVGGPAFGLPSLNEVPGTYTFTFTVYDEGTEAQGSQTYTLTVAPYPTITVSPQNATLTCKPGVLCKMQFSASGGTGPYSFSVGTSGDPLPAGFTLSSSGLLSGVATPSEVSIYVTTPQIIATDAGGFSGSGGPDMFLLAPHIRLSPKVLPPASLDQAYSVSFKASGGAAPYTLAVTHGVLPTGLSMTASGVLSGTPTAAGRFRYTVTATDADGYTASRSFTMIFLKLNSPGDAVFYSSTLAGFTVTAVGGTKTVGGALTPTLSLTGSLPAGLAFSDNGNSTATIEGSTTATGDYPIEITASVPGAVPVNQPLTIFVTGADSTFSSSQVNFTVGVHSSVSVQTAIPPSLIGLGGLPKWLSVTEQDTTSSLKLSGKPPATAASAYNAMVTITGLLPGESPPSFQVDIQQ